MQKYVAVFLRTKFMSSSMDELEFPAFLASKHFLLYEIELARFDFFQAYSLMQELRQRVPGLNMSFYVNKRTIEVICKALDIPTEHADSHHKVITNHDGGGSEDEGEILDEAVEEELQNGFD